MSSMDAFVMGSSLRQWYMPVELRSPSMAIGDYKGWQYCEPLNVSSFERDD